MDQSTYTLLFLRAEAYFTSRYDLNLLDGGKQSAQNQHIPLRSRGEGTERSSVTFTSLALLHLRGS